MVALFDQVAQEYDAWYEDSLGKLVDQTERALISELFKPSGPRILEIGCGTGQYSAWLAAQGYELTAVDVSPAMLDCARTKLASLGFKADWQEADIREIQEQLGVYHGILSVTAMEFIPDPGELLTTMFKHLAPGGCLVVGFIAGGSAWSEFYQRIAAENPDSVFAQAQFYDEEEIRSWHITGQLTFAKGLYFSPGVESPERAGELESQRLGRPGFLVAKWVK